MHAHGCAQYLLPRKPHKGRLTGVEVPDVKFSSRRKAFAAAWPCATLRALLTALCLLTFTMQSVVTATHIHRHAVRSASVTAGSSVLLRQGESGRGLPADQDDPLQCPFCQASLLAGNALIAAPVLPGLPYAVMSLTGFPLRSLHVFGHFFSGTHNRGPPVL